MNKMNRVNYQSFRMRDRRGAGAPGGFTLTEVLISVVLIAVIVVLGFSVTAGVRKRSASIRCIANTKSLVTALLAYAGDHSNRLPAYDDMPTQGNSWWRRIQPYLGYGARNIGTDRDQDQKFRCSEEKTASIVSTYGANYGFVIDYENVSRHAGSMRVSAIPSSAYLVAECKGPIPAIYNPGWWRFSKDSDKDGVLDSDSRLSQPYNHFAFRHGDTGFAGLADGSIRALTKQEWVSNAGGVWGPYYDK